MQFIVYKLIWYATLIDIDHNIPELWPSAYLVYPNEMFSIV